MGKRPKRKSENYKAAARRCREEGHSELRVLAVCSLLCNGYREKYQAAQKVPHKRMTVEEIEKSKQECRDIFLYAFAMPVEESMKVHGELIDRLIALSWFGAKIDKILDEIVDFRWTGNGYVYKQILKKCYFDKEYLPNNVIYDSIGIGKTEFYAKREVGIIIFGLYMWLYCKRRQMEDMDKGRIPWKEIPRGYDDLSKLPPLDEL